MNNELAEKDLKIVKQILDKEGVPFFLAYGTALGAYRDKEFLPGDDDIDLGVIEPIDLKTRKKIGWMMYDIGFKPADVMFNVFGRMEINDAGYNGTEETGIIVANRNISLTIFFFKHEEDKYVCYPRIGAYPLMGFPDRFGKFEKVKFKGTKFNVPSPTEEYLDWVYEEWDNPLKRDHGKLYYQAFPEKKQVIENMEDKKRVIIWKNEQK